MDETAGNQTRIIKNLMNSALHDLQTLNLQSRDHTQELNQIINATNPNKKKSQFLILLQLQRLRLLNIVRI